jgi:hypothetical protein
MIKGGSIQASIAYIVEHAPGVTQGQIENLRTNNATLKYDQTYQTGTQTNYQKQLKAGQRLDVGKGQVYKGSPLASGEAANAYVTILQAGLRSIGSRWCMPEYMISGDASNANYSSTMVAESPFVRNCEVEQAFYKRRFLRIIWAAVRIAADAGRIEGFQFEQVKRLVEIQVECPPVAARKAKEETERNKLLKEAGIISDKTFAGREGLDYEQEQANIAVQPKPEPPPMLLPAIQPEPRPALESLLTESAILPLRDGLAELRGMLLKPAEYGDAPKLSTNQTAIVAALESARTTDEARAILLESVEADRVLTGILERLDKLDDIEAEQRDLSKRLQEVDDMNTASA